MHRVGFIKSAHGLRGEVFIKLFADGADWLGEVETLHILGDADTSPRSFSLKTVRVHKDGLIAVFDQIGDRTAAEAMRGAQVYLPAELLVSAPGDAMYLREILEFELRDPADVVLGRVVDFAYNGAQDLIVVERAGGGRALVPFVEAFIVEIDFDNRVVRMDLPPGLLTLGD